MTFEDFDVDDRTYDAVLMNLAIIGEAAGHIDEQVADRAASVVPWARLRGMRNVIVHEYFGASRRIVWETVVNDLPALSMAMDDLLSGAPDPP
jgi:uncharacterized protein with HEPN domain